MAHNATELFFKLFRKYRIWLILLYLICFGVAIMVLKPRFLRYKGQNTFYMAPDSDARRKFLSPKIETTKVNKSTERVLHLIYSEKMMKKMIKTYDLYSHYGIDTLKPYYHQRAINILISRTEIYKVSGEILRLTVYDRNNEIAAALANSMVGHLDVLYRDYRRREYLNDIEIYRSFMEQSKLSADVQRHKLDSVLQEFKTIVKERPNSDIKELVEAIEYEIRSASSALTAITENQVNTLGIYTETMRLSRPSNINSIVIIKKALPDMRSHRSMLILYSLGVALVSVFVLFSLIYMLHYYKNQLSRLFG